MPGALDPSDLDLLTRLSRRYGQTAENLAQLRRFEALGLLQTGSTAERLSTLRDVAELKAALKSRALPVGGRKADLAARLAASLSPDECGALSREALCYVLTEAGRALVDAHAARKAQAAAEWERTLLDLLLAGKVAEVAAEIDRHKAAESGEPRPAFVLSASAYVACATCVLGLDYRDVALPPEAACYVGPAIALGLMLGSTLPEATKRVLALTGGRFSCPALERWLAGEPCGSFALKCVPRPTDTEERRAKRLAHIYVHTKMFTGSNAARLEAYMSNKWSDGIEVLTAEACPVCDGPRTVYLWGELADLPKLPRHWGCRCMYVLAHTS
ncbi:MAG: SAP domain-containing protein [Phycisphaerales bacterium]